MGNKTKIDWADSTWNPVTGCLHGVCYARKIAERFDGCEHFGGNSAGEFTSPYGDDLLVLDEPVHKELIENVGYYDVEPNVVDCGVAPYPNFFNYTAQDGSKRYVAEVTADGVEFLAKARDGANQAAPPGDAGQDGFTQVDDEELPF